MNLDKIREKLRNIENPQSGSGLRNDLIKLPKGNHTIRIVPYKFDLDMPFQELWMHYNFNNKSFLCWKKMKGEDCPICDFAGEIWGKFKNTGDEAFKETFKQLMPKQRIYMPAIVKESSDESIIETKQVKFWGVASKTYEEILQEVIAAATEDIDITDPEKGLDIIVRMDNFLGRSDRFSVSSIKTARSQTPLIPGTVKDRKALIDTCPDIFSIFEFKEISEIEDALAKHFKVEKNGNDVFTPGLEKDYNSQEADTGNETGNETSDVSKEIDEKFEKLLR